MIVSRTSSSLVVLLSGIFKGLVNLFKKVLWRVCEEEKICRHRFSLRLGFCNIISFLGIEGMVYD